MQYHNYNYDNLYARALESGLSESELSHANSLHNSLTPTDAIIYLLNAIGHPSPKTTPPL